MPTIQDPYHEVDAHRDEISLYDLWAVLVRRRWLLVGVAFIATAAASLYAWTRPTVYEYRTAVEVGTYYEATSGGRVREFIRPPELVYQTLKEQFIPLGRNQHDAPEQRAPKVTLSSEEGIGLFVLRSEGSADAAERIHAVHETIVDAFLAQQTAMAAPLLASKARALDKAQAELNHLQQDAIRTARIEPHRQAVEAVQRQQQELDTRHASEWRALLAKIEDTRLAMQARDEERRLLEAELARIDSRQALLNDRRSRLEPLVADMEQAHTEASHGVRATADATSLLMLSTQLAQNQERLHGIKETLEVGLPARSDKLSQQLSELQIAQEKAGNHITLLREDLATLEADYARNRQALAAKLSQANIELAKAEAEYTRALASHQRAVQAAETALEEVRPSQMLYTGLRSLEPVGPGNSMVVALGAMLGLMASIFTVLMVEFVSGANRHMRAREEAMAEWRESLAEQDDFGQEEGDLFDEAGRGRALAG